MSEASEILKAQGNRRRAPMRGAGALAAVCAMHFVNDLHPTMLPTFLPEIVKRLDLTLAQAGFLSTLFGLLNLIVQPFAGYFADRLNKPSFALWAPILTATGACLLPIAPSYGVAMLFVSLMGFGTANFHPQGHGLAGLSGGDKNLGAHLAVFSAAGTLGAALSPLYGVFLLGAIGASNMPFAILIVPLFALVARRVFQSGYMRGGVRRDESAKTDKGSGSYGFFRVFMICLPIIAISLIRDSTSQGIRVFLPLLVTGRGGSIELGGTMLFAFTLAGSFSNLVGGRMADIFGKRRVILLMLILAPLFLFPAVKTGGILSMGLFVLGGACIAATAPVTIAMAQEMAPESRSTARSLVMGLSWGMANIAASPIGKLADVIGLEGSLAIVALSPLIVVACMVACDAVRLVRK